MALAPSLLLLAALSRAQETPSSAAALDFEFFRARVEPIFLAKREGHARCQACHQHRAQFPLEPLAPGRASWSEEQSRRNFESAARLVAAGEPLRSRLLTMPLAEEAGGDPFHPGGKFWESQDEADWQTLAAWVRTGTAAASAPSAAGTYDLELFRTRVEPIFLRVRDGGAGSCYSCHSRVRSRFRLEPLSPGASSWSEAQSRRNLEAAAGLVTAGEPLRSRLLLHPLAVEAGGDATHTGGKLWQNREDPEWRTIASWVETGSGAAAAAPSLATTPLLDFELFRARVEPLLLKKRSGHARCYACHQHRAQFPLEPLSPGSTVWSEEQSRRNFESARRLVVPGEPLLSRLLTMPLAEEAGGDPFHPGGKFWESRDHPEWQSLADWVRGR